jgi:hypothetical protein
MSPSEGKVWTTWRKVVGNLLPLVLASPTLYFAVQEFSRHGATVRLMLWIATFIVVAWVLLALLGFFGNGAMRREMGRRLHIERAFDKTPRFFVGFARPTFKSALDPHEDVGFLLLHPDRIEFWGSEIKVSIAKSDVTGARFRPNTHTIVGLGRWVSVEAVVNEKPVRLLVESREKPTLVGNLLFSRRFLQAVQDWKAEGPPAEAGGPSESREAQS